MTLLLKSDLSSANSSKAISTLRTDMDDTQKMISAIEDFISSSDSVLVGASFDTIRSHMQKYVDALNKRVKVDESLVNALIKANTTMINYMDGESKLDTSEREAYQSEAESYRSKASGYLDRINSYNSETETVSRNDLFTMYYEAVGEAKKREKIVKLLDELDATDSATYSSLNSTIDEVSSFSTEVGSISTIKV